MYIEIVEHGTVGAGQQVVHKRPRRLNVPISGIFADNPHVSYRLRVQYFGVSGTTLGRILGVVLHLFPYKVQFTRRILPSTSLEIWKTVTQPHFWKEILMTNEAYFTLSGGAWKISAFAAHDIYEPSLHHQKVTTWGDVCPETIVGSFFFIDGETVDGNRYRWMLDHVCPEMREKALDGY
ncbi:hypothetical protein QE152_g41101 [Popillia japonica]|uniref:Uncharacterized protein n=1 Tax=Popillia japonica TaxID=7064 RepID=A0AAW1H176_POPJA